MKKRTVIPLLIVAVIATAAIAFSTLPQVTTAPTTQGPGATDTKPATLPDTILVNQPVPGSRITSPITIMGEARGNWYFEASAPVELKDSSGTVIAHGVIEAQGEWMTTSFVPFKGVLTFSAPITPTGTLILKNDNPSGDPKKQKILEIPVRF